MFALECESSIQLWSGPVTGPDRRIEEDAEAQAAAAAAPRTAGRSWRWWGYRDGRRAAAAAAAAEPRRLAAAGERRRAVWGAAEALASRLVCLHAAARRSLRSWRRPHTPSFFGFCFHALLQRAGLQHGSGAPFDVGEL